MSDRRPDRDAAGLNPKIQPRTDTSRDTTTPTPSPAESTSVQRDEGQGWPALWLVVTVVGVLIILGLMFL